MRLSNQKDRFYSAAEKEARLILSDLYSFSVIPSKLN